MDTANTANTKNTKNTQFHGVDCLTDYTVLGGDPHSTVNQRILSKLVDRNVYFCVSELVGFFMKHPEVLKDTDYNEDDLMDLAFRRREEEDKEEDPEDSEEDNEEYDEVFEHWVVDGFFATTLQEMGEAVNPDFFGLAVWGRTTSGQAISIDYVIAEIAASMEILDGQRYSWAE